MVYTNRIPDVTLSYVGWRQRIEQETLLNENEQLRILARGQEDAIKELIKRPNKREEQFDKAMKKSQRAEAGDPTSTSHKDKKQRRN